jgi:hypothetical protein
VLSDPDDLVLRTVRAAKAYSVFVMGAGESHER